eukprot:jgi/Psemu1/6339/gm1.6339_g
MQLRSSIPFNLITVAEELKRIRHKTDFSVETDENPTVFIELDITYWRFKKNWRDAQPEDASEEEPTDPAAAGNNDAALNRLPDLLQQMVDRGNGNSTAINTGTRDPATPTALRWNPSALPEAIKDR